MRNRFIAIAAAAVLIGTFAAGCKGSKDNTAPEKVQTSSQKETSDSETEKKTAEETKTVNREAEATVAPHTTTAETAPSEAEADGYEQRSETVYAAQDVNVRAGAGTDFEKVGALTAGQAVERTGYTAQWSRVVYNGTECYVASEYLTENQPQAAAPEVPQQNPQELWSGDINTLSNDEFSGIASYDDRDQFNVPNGCYYMKKLYSKYNAVFIEDTTQNVVYLTMDEGYEAGFTPAILNTLREKNVQATFFVTKQFYDSNPELIQQMIDDGHTVGNHTCSHKGMPGLTPEQQTNDVMTLHNLIKDRFGYEMKLFRFPEGLTSERSLALIEGLGYKSVFWSFHYLDYDSENQMNPADALQLCLSSLHPGAVYLLHAKSQTNTEILGQFIDGVRAAGFEFGGGIPVN